MTGSMTDSVTGPVPIPAHAVGDALPELVLDLDRTAVMAAAIASQDYEDVHHDPGKARERGMQDIFLSINTTNGLIDRYVTDWAGPSARLHGVALRLGVPHFAGETLRLTGTVTEIVDGVTTVSVVGRNDGGVYVSATVRLARHEGIRG